MAALTMKSVHNKDNTHTVTRSTDDEIGTARASVIFDSTQGKSEILDAIRAAVRAISREFGKVNSAADFPTTGTSTE